MENFNPSKPMQYVQLRSNPAKRGMTTGRVVQQGTRTLVQVEFGPNDRSFIDSENLEPVVLTETSVADRVLALEFGKKGDLARVLTFQKIYSKLSNVFYSMQTSRTNFYSYQFKPVYKFIESPNGRTLIADEVGLGKTIEAGLIWNEVKARSEANRLLVVCPSMLRPKWKQELRSKFDVQAELVDSAGFLSMLDDFERDGDNFQCAAVCSLQGLRSPRIQAAAEKFEETGHRFDLVIVDEAHYLRNIGTRSHQLGRMLSGIADSMILLTATPIQMKSEDLYRLLNLLDPDEYPDRRVFDDRLRANEPVVTAQNALRRSPADIEQARAEVAALSGSLWFHDHPLLEVVRDRLESLDGNRRQELVEVSRLLEHLNLFSSTISRTRKREVQEWRVVRKAEVINVEFKQPEVDFYEAVTEAVRRQVRASQGGFFEAFSLMMPQRQMASCIPAMVRHYRELLGGQGGEDDDLLEEDQGLGADSEKGDGDAERAKELRREIVSLVEGWEIHSTDSKYDALLGGLRELFAREPDVKVILFSYFKRTLSYLGERLNADGFPTAVIHGDIKIDDRQDIIERFKDRPEMRILLSSEVGSEGLDLQFCRVIINYDLPWNPMKVEQRIGRIDRHGQRSPRISVVNLAVGGTIETKILDRLYTRIGIFERSIGDLEPILGEVIHALTMNLLGSSLSPSEEEERIEMTLRAIEARRAQEAELEENSSVFFGSSDFILSQITEARRLGRWITPAELRAYVTDFFQKRYRGTSVEWDAPAAGMLSLGLSNEARNDLSRFCRGQKELRTALTWESGEPVTLTYTNEASQENPRLEFLSHFHPLARWITETYAAEDNAFFRSSAVEVRSDLVPSGQYLFMVELWDFESLQQELQIAYALVPLDGAGEATPPDSATAELLMQEILDRGQNWPHAGLRVDPDRLDAAITLAVNTLNVRRGEAYDVFQRKNAAAAARKKGHLENYLRRKEEGVAATLYKLRQKGAPEGQIKGQETKLRNIRNQVRDQIAHIDASSLGRFKFDEVAGGVCLVKKG